MRCFFDAEDALQAVHVVAQDYRIVRRGLSQKHPVCKHDESLALYCRCVLVISTPKENAKHKVIEDMQFQGASLRMSVYTLDCPQSHPGMRHLEHCDTPLAKPSGPVFSF